MVGSGKMKGATMFNVNTIDQTKTALIVIDVQFDFLPEMEAKWNAGALAVPNGNDILPEVEALIAAFDNVVITQDWHPADHKSFASAHAGKAPFETTEMPYGTQVLWPDHCVQGTGGAALALEKISIDKAQMLIRKGMNPEIDSYSAFAENDRTTKTGLAGYLRDRGIDHVVLCGLATDFCVAFSALDAVAEGFQVTLVEGACRGIDPHGVAKQIEAMRSAGVTIA